MAGKPPDDDESYDDENDDHDIDNAEKTKKRRENLAKQCKSDPKGPKRCENFSILFPLNKLNFERIFLLSLLVKSDVRVQYSSGLNNSISFSLSVISFKATD